MKIVLEYADYLRFKEKSYLKRLRDWDGIYAALGWDELVIEENIPKILYENMRQLSFKVRNLLCDVMEVTIEKKK